MIKKINAKLGEPYPENVDMVFANKIDELIDAVNMLLDSESYDPCGTLNNITFPHSSGCQCKTCEPSQNG